MSESLNGTTAVAVGNSVAKPGIGRVLILALLIGFTSISTDMYLPAMQVMSQEFGVPATRMAITLSGFLLGFSVGQLAWGPVGDRFGRRGPIAVGIVLFIIGSAGCALSAGLWQVVGFRVLQAFGACAAPVLARATVRDLYDREKAAQVFSMLIAIMCVAPLAAPLFGGQMLRVTSWRTIFWTLCLVGIVALVCLARLPESLPAGRRIAGGWKQAFRSYAVVASDVPLLGYAAAGAFYYAGMFVYVAGTPFVYTTYYQVPAQYFGLLFAFGVAATSLSNVANSRLVPRYGSETLLRLASIASAGLGLALAMQTWTGFGGLPALMVLVVGFLATGGFITANASAAALAGHPERAGTAAAFIGSVQSGFAVLATAMLDWIGGTTPLAFGLLIAACSVGCAVALRARQSGTTVGA